MGSGRRENRPAEFTLAELFTVIPSFITLRFRETGLVTHSFRSVGIAMGYGLDGREQEFSLLH
jgi:hypothetical protein